MNTHQCPTHGTIPDAPWCPICDAPQEPSIREMCRSVLLDWVAAWPDPQAWKHEVRWTTDGIAVLSQKATSENIWSCSHIFNRTDLERGPNDIVKWQALRTWGELHKTADQQGD